MEIVKLYIMIGLIAKFIVALNSNSRPGEMASATAFGLLLALIPGGNLLWTLLFLLAFFLKHNMGSFLLSLSLFRLITPLFDSMLSKLGGVILDASFLGSFFTVLSNLPFLSYTNFNNTIVMGAFAAGVISWIPVFILFVRLVRIYRKTLAPIFSESKIVKALKKVPILSKLTKAVSKLSVAI